MGPGIDKLITLSALPTTGSETLSLTTEFSLIYNEVAGIAD
jgi:hypothetical protein